MCTNESDIRPLLNTVFWRNKFNNVQVDPGAGARVEDICARAERGEPAENDVL